jgi:hypothetical protein
MKFNTIDRMMLLIRLFYVAASGLLISGGAISLDGQRTGDYLVQAAYIIFAVIISIIITMVLYLRSQKSRHLSLYIASTLGSCTATIG